MLLEDTVRWREIAREAWRNTATGTSRPLVLGAILTIVLGVGVAFAAHQTTAAIETYDSYLERGSATTVIRSPNGIDPQRCAALNEVAGVRGAVALRQDPDGVTLAALPSFEQPRIAAVGDVSAMLGSPPAMMPGVLLSEEMSTRLGLAPGESLALSAGKTTLAGTFAYPDDGRIPLFATAVVEPLPRGDAPFDQCWVTVWPPRDDYRSLLTSSIIPIEGQSPETQLLNHSLGEPRPLSVLVADSSAGWMQAGGALLAFFLGGAWVRSRRVELALALHLGQPRHALYAQVVGEATLVAWTVAPATFVLTVIMVAPRLPGPELASVVLGAAATALGIVAALSAGVLTGLLFVHEAKISDWAKDR